MHRSLSHYFIHAIQLIIQKSNSTVMAKLGGLSEQDPRLTHDPSALIFNEYIRPQHRELYDSKVSFEEYIHYAKQTRADQDATSKTNANRKRVSLLKVIFPLKSDGVELDHKMANLNTSIASQRAVVTDEEWTNASKAMRNATAMAIFYLLTTDVLGPFALPYAVATTGWG
jgi:hypothetical protein